MIQGKGWFIWVISDCEGGDQDAIAGQCAAGDIRHVLIKIADGTVDKNPEAADLVAKLKEIGVDAWGWQYTYGSSPANEALKGANRAIETGVEGFIVDAEGQYKTAGAAAAETYMETLLANLPAEMQVGLSSYRYPSLHPEFPWDAFLDRVHFVMPQVYWEQAHNPAYQLSKSYGEYLAKAPGLPYIPTGAAYKRGDWESTPADVTAFLDQALAMDLPGANFWEWGRARLYVEDTWQAIADYEWPHDDILPGMLRVSAIKHVPIRLSINGEIVTFAHYDQLLGVSGVAEDDDDKVWYEVGYGWVPAWAVQVVG